MEEKKKYNYGLKIETQEDCLQAIKELFGFLLVMAGIMLAASLVIGQFGKLLPDVIMMAVCGLLIKKYQSRTLAVIIFLYSLGIGAVTLAKMLHLPGSAAFGGGTNVALAALFVYTSLRAVIATFRLSKLNNYSICWKNFFIKSAIFVGSLVVLEFVVIVLAGIMKQNDAVTGLFIIFAFFIALFLSYAGIFPHSDKLKIKYVKTVVDNTETDNNQV